MELAYQAANLLVSAEERSCAIEQVVRHHAVSEVQEGDAVVPTSPNRWRSRSRPATPWTAAATPWATPHVTRFSRDDDEYHSLSTSGPGPSRLSAALGQLCSSPADLLQSVRRSLRWRTSAADGASATTDSPPSPSLSPSRSSYRRQQQTITSDGEGLLPKAAHTFVGVWKYARSENYGSFLSEVAGLPWHVRRVAERIHPAPTFEVRDGLLHCETVCFGAKSVHEVLVPGESHFHEPNLDHHYVVSALWHGAKFVATRRSDEVNGGKPTVQSRWVDADSDELQILQDWGGPKAFRCTYTRVKGAKAKQE